MKKKQISSLLFSLLIVATCDNLKAASEKLPKTGRFSRGPKKSELYDNINNLEKALQQAQANGGQDCQNDLGNCSRALDICKENSSQLEQECESLVKERDSFEEKHNNIMGEYAHLKREIEGDEKNLGLRQELTTAQRQYTECDKKLHAKTEEAKRYHSETVRLQKQIDRGPSINQRTGRLFSDTKALAILGRCQPYIYGTRIAGAAYLGLSSIGSKRLEPLRKAVGDSTVLQGSSLAAASFGGRPHRWISRRSKTEFTYFKDNDIGAGALNVAGETGNSFLLRWGWNTWCADHVKNNDNFVVKFIHESKILKDLIRLAAIHTFWKLEKKGIYGFLKQIEK